VGLDVVRNEVAALGGRIDVDSRPGLGATFRLHLPVTLALSQAVLVKVGDRTYAIPSSMVQQASELKPAVIEKIRAAGEGEWMGTSYPWHYLNRLLGQQDARPLEQRRHWVIFVRSGSQRVLVEVDDLLGGQELVVKNIGPQLARVAGISGATVLGDGEIVLIVNPVALAERQPSVVTMSFAADMAGAIASTPVQAVPATPPAQPLIMVVDDSLTVRKITGRLLERAGYRVATAKDGVDALEKLIDTIPDVVLADIEMPRMDGFDLVRNMRNDPRLKAMPVIMITSRTAEKHRAYAREIGVDHYLGKPYDEEQLLGLIAGFVGKH
jgi:chemosensory pili system protein ChpA (sensor histidine kinase/response regulator)